MSDRPTRDLDIRRVLRAQVAKAHGDSETLIVEELALCEGAVRVDLAVVNGVIHGYEIKSESDTLARLPAQTSAYNRALDRVTMVCGLTHLSAVDRMIPHWWGIQVAAMNEGTLRLSPVRMEGDNPHPEPFAQAQLLWRDEALAALEARDLAAGHRSKPRRALWRLLAVHLDAAELGDLVRETLRSRRDWRVALPLA